ncbi:hypothetical protein [Corynebacterium belfantii]|uniref:hypothetical protein n=1 Tax=Corynebacterium belfantii TaxID=2014537 RepID=UPI0018CB7B1C|nr:hypothetical protein [Corynebacterium belfantii]MBG9244284.1 hypothetical protein [Corynebacterium belfantii]MBG9258708.1 hypothetical protein [Corynebacterium belfantii]MBG9265371.1 hypothetical protein [Corynebacterium belfantii]MBG9299088.1 hypothetical protein [Corynebacterium belfantii]MBG9307166.1 hypothetical protein [Corynebacterium belfantii]
MTRQSLGERLARPHFDAIVAVDKPDTIVATCLYAPCPRNTQADHPTAGVARVVADSDLTASNILMFGPMAVDSPAYIAAASIDHTVTTRPAPKQPRRNNPARLRHSPHPSMGQRQRIRHR